MGKNEEIIINTQLALFFNLSLIKPEEFWQSFNIEMGGIFDQTPTILPVPDDPNLYEVPIVQMNSTKNIYSCNISRKRVDFFIAGVGRQKFEDIKSDLLEKLEKYYEFFSKKIQIKRIGFVTRFFVEDAENNETIARLIINDFRSIIDGTTRETYFRYISRDKIDGFDINNLTIVEKFYARISGIGENIRGILITRDFNTIPEENYKNIFDSQKIKDFIMGSETKFKLGDIKKILWPMEK